MHSRLFVISGNEKVVSNITEDQLIDNGFCERIADYVNEINDKEQKENDIKDWLFINLKTTFNDYIELDKEKLSFKLKKGAVKYFLDKKFKKLKELLEEKPEETIDMRSKLFQLYETIKDEFGFYFATSEDNYVYWYCSDDFLELEYNEEKTYYITQVFDYHF